MAKNTYIISMGTNLGERELNLKMALQFLNSAPFQLIKTSKYYEYEAWGYQSDNKFLNLACCIESILEPIQVLEELKKYESAAGREIKNNKVRYSDRIIDMDILFCNNDCIELKDLIIPHPRLAERKFVLEPLNEIMPEYIHPKLKLSIHNLYLNLKHE